MFKRICNFLKSHNVIYPTRNPSARHNRARIRKGAACPITSNKNPPKGGAIRDPNEMKAREIPRALWRSFSSVNRSATKARALVSAKAEPYRGFYYEKLKLLLKNLNFLMWFLKEYVSTRNPHFVSENQFDSMYRISAQNFN